jgi:hypothetical protein
MQHRNTISRGVCFPKFSVESVVIFMLSDFCLKHELLARNKGGIRIKMQKTLMGNEVFVR